MNLTDLLDELRSGILNDKTARVSGTADYLWTDARLIRYIDEAQNRFATKSLVIRDGRTAECCQVTLVEGQTEYPLHEAVIAVVSAKISTATADLARVGHSLISAYRPTGEQWYDSTYYTGIPAGTTLAYSTDEGVSDQMADGVSQVVLRVYPEPNADAAGTIIQLRVVRKPLARLTIGNMSTTPEIPEDHHLEMLDWAAYLALRIVDDDAGAPKRAGDFAASFEVHVKNARNAAMRKMFAPLPWGYGRGGWVWGS